MSNIKVTTDSGKFIAGARTDSGDHVGDVYLYHNGSNSFIENETGILYVTNKASASLILGTANTTAVTIDNSQQTTFTRAGASDDNKATVKIEPTGSYGMGLYVYSNADNDANALVQIHADNSSMNMPAFRVIQDGTGDACWLGEGGGAVVIGGNAKATVSGATDLTIGNTTGSHGLSIIAQANTTANIFFGEAVGTMPGKIQYDNDGADMSFTSGDSFIFKDNSSTMMTLDGGNVGIGESAPSAPLEITDTGSGIKTMIKLNNNRSTSQADGDGTGILVEGAIADNGSSTTYGRLICEFDDVSQGTIDSSWRFKNYVNNNETEVMSIVAGNVGIGTDSPAAKLDVYDGSIQVHAPSATGNAWTYYKNSDRTWLVGNRGSGGDSLSFYDLTADVERMRIDSSGNVGIGTTAPTAFYPTLQVEGTQPAIILNDSNSDGFTTMIADGGNSNFYFDHSGAMRFLEATNNGGSSGAVRFVFNNNGTADKSSGAGDWADASDKRLKKDVEDLSIDALNVLNTLRPVQFKWKNEKTHQTPRDSNGNTYGFLADEIETVIPQLVTTSEIDEKSADREYLDEDGMAKKTELGIMASLYIKAIQQLSEQNKALEAKVEALEAK